MNILEAIKAAEDKGCEFISIRATFPNWVLRISEGHGNLLWIDTGNGRACTLSVSDLTNSRWYPVCDLEEIYKKGADNV